MKDLGTALGGYPVYHEGGLELLCNARSEQEVLSALRTILGIPLSRDRLRPEKLTAEELAELAVQHRG